MPHTADRSPLRVEVHAKGCDVPTDERARMETLLANLTEAVRDRPPADLAIHVIHHVRNEGYRIKLTLQVSGQTLNTAEEDPYLDAAYQRAIRKLERKVEALPVSPNGKTDETWEPVLALNNDVVAPEDPNMGPVGDAAQRGDYRAFRTSLSGYEEWLRKRVGRWIQRCPTAQGQLGRGLLLGDVIEEVYLNAFERFPHKPTNVRLSEWLENLIDPSVKALLRNPDEESENASLAAQRL